MILVAQHNQGSPNSATIHVLFGALDLLQQAHMRHDDSTPHPDLGLDMFLSDAAIPQSLSESWADACTWAAERAQADAAFQQAAAARHRAAAAAEGAGAALQHTMLAGAAQRWLQVHGIDAGLLDKVRPCASSVWREAHCACCT